MDRLTLEVLVAHQPNRAVGFSHNLPAHVDAVVECAKCALVYIRAISPEAENYTLARTRLPSQMQYTPSCACGATLEYE